MKLIVKKKRYEKDMKKRILPPVFVVHDGIRYDKSG